MGSTRLAGLPDRLAASLIGAGLGSRVLLPSDEAYGARQASYWSKAASSAEPTCIVQPKTAQDVAAAVKALVSAEQPFAIRSGGHTQWEGSNNIQGGVTIDLGLLSWTRYDEASDTVDVGPGTRWRDVYAALHPHGRIVAGGREGGVGVAGLLLGGGMTFLTARLGFACDNVVAYEVVLADGTVVTADAGRHADLFRVLKGGSNNFGIVTNFRLRAVECGRVWGGLTFFDKSLGGDAIDRLVDFTAHVADDVDSNLLCFFTYTGNDKAPAYAKWSEMPSLSTTCKFTTIPEILTDYGMPSGYYNIWFTLTLKNEAGVAREAARGHAELVRELAALVPDGDFVTQCLLQPLPRLVGQHAAAAGGNVLGVADQAGDGLLLLAAAMVRTRAQHDAARPRVRAWVDGLAARRAAHVLPWRFLNYADGAQDPLASYGPANVARMRRAAARYDPAGVWADLCVGGFKLPRT